jgi:ribonucleoside-diphosphate reductase alpha chain
MEVFESLTIKTRTGCGNLYVTLNFSNNTLKRVFIRIGKGGSCRASQTEAIARLINKALEYNIPLEEIIHSLKEIRCPSTGFDEEGIIKSCSDGVARTLEKYLKELKTEVESYEQAMAACPS